MNTDAHEECFLSGEGKSKVHEIVIDGIPRSGNNRENDGITGLTMRHIKEVQAISVGETFHDGEVDEEGVRSFSGWQIKIDDHEVGIRVDIDIPTGGQVKNVGSRLKTDLVGPSSGGKLTTVGDDKGGYEGAGHYCFYLEEGVY
jgi:hypothetical protein